MPSATREVRIQGSLEEGDVSLLIDHLEEIVGDQPQRVVVDLSTCPAMDPAAVDVLVRANERLRTNGVVVDLRGTTPEVLALLQDRDVLDLFDHSPAKRAV